jgi:hypothetical protein
MLYLPQQKFTCISSAKQSNILGAAGVGYHVRELRRERFGSAEIGVNVPTWARKAGCPMNNEALGPDYDAAVARAENVC